LEERLLLAIVVRCMQYLLSWVLRSALNTWAKRPANGQVS
jgi:hypothetical protein